MTALDKDGNIVLIEIKRDAKDIKARQESFAFQAIRYVASYSKIQDVATLAKKIYVPYLERYVNPNLPTGNNIFDVAERNLNAFLKQNGASTINEHQRIILVAGEFDEQTLSAAAWLSKNGIDISCYEVSPYKMGEKIILNVNQLIPLKDYIVDIAANASGSKTMKVGESKIHRAKLPKINALVKAGVFSIGDQFVAKDYESEVVELYDNRTVKIVETEKSSLTSGAVMTLQQWLRLVYEWSSVDTYNFTKVKSSKNDSAVGKLMFDVRQEWLEKNNTEPV